MKKIFYLLPAMLFISCANSELEQCIERGATIYEKKCIKCHMIDGKEIPEKYPPLAQADWLTEKREQSIHATKFGIRGEIIVNGVYYNGIQIPLGLNDQEVADVLNYVMNSWGNEQEKMVTAEEVSKVPKKMKR
jgi:mono/diheme cytochrome c family protein